MKKINFILFFLLSFGILKSQEFNKTGSYSELTSDYLPEGYSVLTSVKGDLNRDAFQDLIIVFKSNNETDTSNTVENPILRPLVIYTGSQSGTYTLAATNNKTVLCLECGGLFGDPFQGIVIYKGLFRVEHLAGSNFRWTRNLTFKISRSDGKWYLNNDDSKSYHTSKPNDIESINKTTKDFGIVPFEDFDIYKE